MQFSKILIVSSIIFGLFAFLWVIICALFDERIQNIIQPKDGYIFDYVIVGAGTGGSVVASLLAKHSNSTVLLIEAGDKFGILSKIPVLTTFQQGSINDWSFLSVPQKYSSKGLENHRQSLPRGKGIGGSAQMNFMLHYDAHEYDFDIWSKQYNLTEWEWSLTKPFIEAGNPKVFETFEIPHDYTRLSEALHQAQADLAHKNWRFRRSKYNIKNGLRYNVLQRFLQPTLSSKRNLHVMTNAVAKRIILNTNENGDLFISGLSVGVKDEATRKEQIFKVDINRELILSAGAYQTPQLLLVSGIGDENELKTLKISLQKHLPKVGKNLHDHFNQPLFVTIDVIGPTLNQKTLLNPLGILKYLTSGGGPWGNFGVVGHIDDVGAENSFALTFFGAGAIEETTMMTISNFKRGHFRSLFPRYYNSTQEGFVLVTSCLQPKSRGSVTIANANIRKNPLIDPNYLSNNDDVKCALRAIRAAVEVIETEAFAELRPHILWPKVKECANFGPFERDFILNKPSDRYLECLIQYVGLTSHHPGGSCTMGTSSDNSVVDSQFRVHGVKGMRIIDASVLPTPISGNPNSIVVAMAIRGATLILKNEMRGM